MTDNKKPDINEALERNWNIPDFTIKEIREAIPDHCFQRDTLRSLSYLFNDVFYIALLAYGASWIDTIPSRVVRYSLWVAYWLAQGTVGFALWLIGHEAGHQAVSPSKSINSAVGMFAHSVWLLPFHSWKISHSRHHKGNGHMTKDQVYVPYTRSQMGLPPKEVDPEGDGPHHMWDESGIKVLWDMFLMLTLGFPLYLLLNKGGQDYEGWTSHFNPYCEIFQSSQFGEVMTSVAGVATMISILVYLGQQFGSLAVFKFYVVPYLLVNAWLILITYLHHTSPDVPRYRDGVWNFQRGAALTVDRTFGKCINHVIHHLPDTHVAHHFFSTIPHYHAVEATQHIKKVLGKYYQYDPQPIPLALWRTWLNCRFVEDEGDVVFFKQ